MGKFTFNTSIGMDMKAASADSFVDNIQMIEFSEIKQNKDNFYTLSELELLADDIERQGLKHNLVVCKDSTGLDTGSSADTGDTPQLSCSSSRTD